MFKIFIIFLNCYFYSNLSLITTNCLFIFILKSIKYFNDVINHLDFIIINLANQEVFMISFILMINQKNYSIQMQQFILIILIIIIIWNNQNYCLYLFKSDFTDFNNFTLTLELTLGHQIICLIIKSNFLQNYYYSFIHLKFK